MSVSPHPPDGSPDGSSPQKNKSSRNYSIEQLKRKALKQEPLPTDSVSSLQELLSEMIDERKTNTINRKFKEGIKIAQCIDHVKKYHLIAQKKQYQSEQREENQRQLAEVKERISSYDQEWDEEEKKLKQGLADSRARLIDNLHAQQEEHEKLWASDSQKRKYNRASNELRVMREQIQKLLISNRFKDAEEVLSRADKLQASEQAANSRLMQTDYTNATKLLDQRIAQELESFDQQAQLQIANFKTRRERNKNQYDNQLKKCEQRAELVEDIDRLWNVGQKQVFDQTLAKSRSSRIPPKSTHVSASDFGKRTEPLVLSLPPLTPRKGAFRPLKNADYF